MKKDASRSIIVALSLAAGVLAGCGNMGNPPAAFTTVTADGWTISVCRYEPAKADSGRMPVILCHGLSYNGQFFDLAPEISLALDLQQAGYDVWVPSLRGAGWSTKPPYSRLRQLFRGDLYTTGGVFTSMGRGALKINWTVDDHVRYDLPAIIDLVLKESKHKQVHWIGHSMGGMIMVAHLATQPEESRVASFVALGVPVFAPPPLRAPLEQLAKSRGAVEISNAVISTNLPALIGLIGGKQLSTPIDALFFNKANVSDTTIRLLNSWGTEDISPGQLAQLIDMLAKGRFTSTDGSLDYTASLEKAKIPALFVAGTVDNLAPADAVKPLYNRWGAAQKRFLLFGAAYGQQIDYGHDDLVIGKNAKAEVYPAIRQWLDSGWNPTSSSVHPR